MRTKILPIFVLSLAYGVGGCGSSTDSGATGGSGGHTSSTQATSSGGAGSGGSSNTPTGGNPMGGSSSVVVTGGSQAGGTLGTGGASTTPTTSIATGGSSAVGGTTSIGPTTGGSAAGGSRTGGSPKGGTTSTGGTAAGGAATGGTSTGGTTPDGGSTALDCSAPMPTSGGTTHCGSYKTGKAGSLSWELWSNSYNSNACITYYSTPSFSAKWNNNSDYLARLGIEWGGKTIAQLGEITAEFAYKKTGSAGGYSYIGVYGWATNPCTEYYIIDDSFGGMPFSPWNMQGKGSATIDGEVYKFFSGSTNGTGGSRCNSGGSFTQNWSVRQKGRQCGVMTISKHFEEWKKVGMSMDSILEAKILVETGGGQGNIDFPIANVKASK